MGGETDVGEASSSSSSASSNNQQYNNIRAAGWPTLTYLRVAALVHVAARARIVLRILRRSELRLSLSVDSPRSSGGCGGNMNDGGRGGDMKNGGGGGLNTVIT